MAFDKSSASLFPIENNEETASSSSKIGKDTSWGKSLKEMPLFSIKEIEIHRQASGKNGKAIIKTLDRGRKFKEERYLSADSIFTRVIDNFFSVKAKCKASMKKEFREVKVSLNRETGLVVLSKCSCPAGNSGYCNHVMALLFELADYSLHQLETVPEETACTSKSRQWGIPGQSGATKVPAMTRTVKKLCDKRGISCTLYDARINESRSDLKIRALELQGKLQQKDERIGFAHCIDMSLTQKTCTKFGEFSVGSTLSHQLAPLGSSNIHVLTNIIIADNFNCTEHNFTSLPLSFIPQDHVALPTDWGILLEKEVDFFERIKISKADSFQIEKQTILQSNCAKWYDIRKERITSSNAHKVITRKRNFESLADQLLNPKSESELPQMVQDAFKHGREYEPVARRQYEEYLKYSLRHDVSVWETGIVVQPHLFWLAASPDGLVTDKTGNAIGLLEIKCPKSKKNSSPEELVNDDKFYVSLVDGKPELKKDHPNGYYSQIQMAMGLSGAPFCDFIVYTFKGLIIARTLFDNEYFINLIQKLNTFYRKYMLPRIINN